MDEYRYPITIKRRRTVLCLQSDALSRVDSRHGPKNSFMVARHAPFRSKLADSLNPANSLRESRLTEQDDIYKRGDGTYRNVYG
jgi:hypothetical protein